MFRNPYLLDLLGLKGAFSERDFESAILREIEGVPVEWDAGLTFVARQNRMASDGATSIAARASEHQDEQNAPRNCIRLV